MSDATLRAKMLVQEVTKHVDVNGEISQEVLKLRPVHSGSEANKQWSKWTPGGELSLYVSNPSAFDKILPGQFFFVDLIPTTKDE